ncbi:glutathione S-transferase T2-like [Brassica napus]|uniref:glutathione S-transferase T2-like n=1 Tax=Brassica napus TaxID=3708 RepID=UPI002078E5DD|nr:glutathione S-transferase T2-like [Brassica napus]
MAANNTSYVNLLFSQSQSPVDLDSPEPFWFGTQGPDASPTVESAVDSPVRKERRPWSTKEDKILIGAWLNTSKDAVVSNEQKAARFWSRIVDYYNKSPQLVGTVPRELGQCKQRWARINEQVCKFVGCYDTALREQSSGQNDDDVMIAALDNFSNQYSGSGKEKRKGVEVVREEEVVRPVGVKAAKAATKKKKSVAEESLSQIQAIMEMKDKLSKQKLLDRLLAKKDPLTEMEKALQLKLMSNML